MVALFSFPSKSPNLTGSGIFFHPKTGRYASSRPGFKVLLTEQARVMDEGESPQSKKQTPFNPAAVAAAASTSAQRMDRPDLQQGPYAITSYRRREQAARTIELAEGPAPVHVTEYQQIIVADQMDRPLRFQAEHLRDAWHTGRLKLSDGQEISISRHELSRDHLRKELAVNVIHLARTRASRMAA